MTLRNLALAILLLLVAGDTNARLADSTFYPANHNYLRYTGRFDYSSPLQPKCWASGAYLTIRFNGTYCTAQINDQVRWGTVHNYIEIQVDDQAPKRLQLTGKENRLVLAEGLTPGEHTIIICKNTESENGYIAFAGVTCKQLLKPKAPKHRIEFIGDSITCGYGADESEISCGKGQWFDQHNAWMAYGPTTARALNADWHLSAVSGIGLIHSCCNKTILMPQVYDKINQAGDSLNWNFNNYKPEVVTICLGQNDGIQDSTAFCTAYVQFAQRLRKWYPKATLVLLTSPMASPDLKKALVNYTTAVRDYFHAHGDRNVAAYTFTRQSISGCSSHPTVAEQQQVAGELTHFLRTLKHW